MSHLVRCNTLRVELIHRGVPTQVIEDTGVTQSGTSGVATYCW